LKRAANADQAPPVEGVVAVEEGAVVADPGLAEEEADRESAAVVDPGSDQAEVPAESDRASSDLSRPVAQNS